jgi:hypothetical protein
MGLQLIKICEFGTIINIFYIFYIVLSKINAFFELF